MHITCVYMIIVQVIIAIRMTAILGFIGLSISLLSVILYCIVQNFDGGRNFDIFDAFQLDRQNLTNQIV